MLTIFIYKHEQKLIMNKWSPLADLHWNCYDKALQLVTYAFRLFFSLSFGSEAACFVNGKLVSKHFQTFPLPLFSIYIVVYTCLFGGGYNKDSQIQTNI